MSVSHHLTDITIQEYAAGSLGMALETLVACHMTVCAHCRHKAALADHIGGNLISRAEPASVVLSATELLSSASTKAVAEKIETPYVQPAEDQVPRPLGRLLETRLSDLPWRRIAPGIRQHKLSTQHPSQGAFQLLHLQPGVCLSDHTHSDKELTYVVQGSYTDELGQFRAGDIADLDGQHSHQPRIDSTVPCIALIASQSPAKFSGVIGKIMQPFVGL